MIGKRVLVTGATNGIGKQAALELAAMGAAITIVGRDEVKTRQVRSDIKRLSGNAEVDFLVGDLSSFAETRRVADKYLELHGRLDALLNNAGASFSSFATSADGIEMTYALNHFSYYLLANLLLDVLTLTAKAHGEARIVNVSSSAHSSAAKGLNLDDLRSPDNFASFRNYGGSKLANLLFTYELARRLAGTGVTVNAAHPGLVNTGLGDNMSGIVYYLFKLMKSLAGRKPKKGAETLVYLASSPEVAGVNGGYWADKTKKRSSDISNDRAQQKALWDYSAEVTGVG